MTDVTSAIVAYIDKRLDGMVRAPSTWGTVESLDLQALLLLELRTFVLRKKTHESDPFEARDAYIALVAERFPSAAATFLSNLVPQERAREELVTLLQELRVIVNTLGPEDPFAHYPLVIEIEQQKRYRTASFGRVCYAFNRFERALLHAWPGGAPRSVKKLFEVPELHLPPAQEGKGTRAQLLVSSELPPKMTHEDLARALQSVLAQKHLLRPGPGVELVRFGGTLIGNPSVEIKREERLRIAVSARVEAPGWFEQPEELPTAPPRLSLVRAAG